MTVDESVIEIRDPEVNVPDLVRHVQERLDERRRQASATGQDYDRLADDPVAVTAGNRLPADFYDRLQELRTHADSLWVTPAVRNRRIPLLNPIAFRIERLLHLLAVKYVNLLAERQITYNHMTEQTLSALAEIQENDAARLETLEREVARLRDLVTRLEAAGREQA